MRLSISILSCMIVALAYSTAGGAIILDKEPAILEVHYIKTQVSDTLTWKSHSDPMVLRIGKTASMFYPLKRMWADSLMNTNFKMHERLHREINPPGKPYTLMGGLEREFVFRNVTDGETMVYQNVAGEYCSYTEPTETPVWELRPDTKTIMGYPCQLAACNFRGRIWEAWFTTEIPVNEGPWKLFGLPGLILEASDTKRHYSYKVAGMVTGNLLPVGIRIYIRIKPRKMKSRDEYLQKIYRERLQGSFSAKMSAMFGNPSDAIPQKSQYDLQETDYPHN